MNEALTSKDRRWLFVAALVVGLIGYGVFGPSKLTKENIGKVKIHARITAPISCLLHASMSARITR